MHAAFCAFYAVIIVAGVMNLCGFLVPLQKRFMSRYTESSVRRWMIPGGFFVLLFGVGVICFDTYIWRGVNNYVLLYMGIAGIGVAVTGTLVTMLRLIKR